MFHSLYDDWRPGDCIDHGDEELDLIGDFDWEWIYADEPIESNHGHSGITSRPSVDGSSEEIEPSARNTTLRKTAQTPRWTRRIIGARHGRFKAFVGQAFLLKNDGKEPWVALLHGCLEDELEGQKMVSFMWFSSPREVRNVAKRRTDFLPNEIYITANFDENPLDSIVGRALIFSPEKYVAKYPGGKISRNSNEYGKAFVCRRGCNTRTATYTEVFLWENVYGSANDLEGLRARVEAETKATRKHNPIKPTSPGPHGVTLEDPKDVDVLQTPHKRRKTNGAVTPGSRSGKCRKVTTPGQGRTMNKKPLEFTPLGKRTLLPQHASSPFQVARSRLHVSTVPSALPCREAEFDQVYRYLESAITAGTGSCIYISGTPGTGKTATVREVIASLSAAVDAEELDDFIFVEINGMKVTDPHQSYSLLWEALTGDRLSPAHALNRLEREFSRPSPRRVPCVVLMDELDQLVTKTQSVMYNFFNWPGLLHSRLIVLAVANTMDLPERTLSNKISSRLGLTRITFPGYSHEQLIKIIESRLTGVPGSLVDADAIQFASRKVAQVSGDARRALDICRRAVEIAESEELVEANFVHDNDENLPPALLGPRSKRPSCNRVQAKAVGVEALKAFQTTEIPADSPAVQNRVTIVTIQRAIREATTSPLQWFLRALPLGSKVFLSALLTRAQRTGVAECVMGDVMDEAKNMINLSSKQGISSFSYRQNDAMTVVGVAGVDGLVGNPIPKKRRKSTESLCAENTFRVQTLDAAATMLMDAGVVVIESSGGTSGCKVGERTARTILNVAEQEVRLALRGDEDMTALGIIMNK